MCNINLYMFVCMFPNIFVYVSKCSCVFVQMCLCICPNVFLYVLLCTFVHLTRCGYCRRRFFFREKGRSRIWGTCHIGENTVFQLFCVSGALWVTFGVPLAPFGVALAPFGVPLGSLWGALGSLWVPLSSLWLPLGRLGLPLQTSSSMFTVCDACRQNQASWNTPQEPREPREPRKRCQELLLGAHLPHAPGARMTVVTQTPSNKKF